MSHARTQIRRAVKAALTGVTSAGARVYTKRIADLPAADLPALVILSGDEDVQPANLSGAMDRTTSVAVQGYVKAPDDGADKDEVQDALDDLMVEVEELLGSFFLAGVRRFTLETVSAHPTADAPSSVGAFELRYSAQYSAQFGAPQTIL